ncbi:hypothetical protein IHE61_26065 [Streptomyces sp. GKU 257-1]|nr:hypothetical protein [Streptomyces sp. GKU 257-1]
MTCYETGERSRLIHAVREYNGRENQPKGFGSRKRIQYRPHLVDWLPRRHRPRHR